MSTSHRKLPYFAVFVAILATGCGSASTVDMTVKDTDPDNTYICQNDYFDTDLQTNPLWTEAYEVNPMATEGTQKQFGVSPGDGDYWSNIGPNGTEGIALQIFNNATQVGSFAAFQNGTATLMAALQTSAAQTLVISCIRL